MTQKRRDNNSTEFGLWLREQPEIESRLGYITSNIDFVWKNYKTKEFMLIEEKRYGWHPKQYQFNLYRDIDSCCSSISRYKGFHVLIFEKTSPDDGMIWLDGRILDRNQLVYWLCFRAPSEYYKSYFPEADIIKINFEIIP